MSFFVQIGGIARSAREPGRPSPRVARLFGIPLYLVAALAFLFYGIGSATAGLLRQQHVNIASGWNAVFLEVEPDDSDPAVVFTNTPVDIVACYYRPLGVAQFMTDPSADMLRQSGWGVWYAPNRPDAFLSSLHAIYGQMAYLVHATTNFTWELTGQVRMPQNRWQADCYNLVGFGVDAQSPPSFAQFFAGATAHNHDKIYRLVNGSWRRVTSPDAAIMRSGEAFWMYCEGGSDYMGPMAVKTPSGSGLTLGSTPNKLTLRNHMPYPVAVTLSHVPGGTNAVPLSLVVQALGDTNQPVRIAAAPVPLPDGAWTQDLPPLEAGVSIAVPLAARLEDMRTRRQSSLLLITTDLGTEVWVPVTALRKDLEGN